MYPEQPCGQNKTTGLTKASAGCVQDAQNKVLHSQDPLSFNKHMACSNATGIHQVANQCHTVHAQKLQVGPGAGQVCRRCTQSVVDVWSVRQWCKSSQEFEGLCCLLKASILRIHTQMTWWQIMVSLSFHIDKKYQELITFGNQSSCFNISVNIFSPATTFGTTKVIEFSALRLGGSPAWIGPYSWKPRGKRRRCQLSKTPMESNLPSTTWAGYRTVEQIHSKQIMAVAELQFIMYDIWPIWLKFTPQTLKERIALWTYSFSPNRSWIDSPFLNFCPHRNGSSKLAWSTELWMNFTFNKCANQLPLKAVAVVMGLFQV